MRRVLWLCATLATALVVVPSATAAAPNYIMVTGHGMARPVLLASWKENLDLMVAVAKARRARAAALRGLARRPRLDFAEFWNWSYLPRPTRPSQANQHGWFYPAHESEPAVIAITVDGTDAPRVVPRKVLRIF